MDLFIPNQYDKEEDIDEKMFSEFSRYFPEIYARTAHTEASTFFDVLSQNYTGGTALVELKSRNSKYIDQMYIFIEPSKFNNMSNAYADKGLTPVYINFMKGLEIVYVFYLPQVRNLVYYPKVLINGSYKARLGLNVGYAHKYIWNPEKKMYDYIAPTLELGKMEKAAYYDESIFNQKLNNKTFR